MEMRKVNDYGFREIMLEEPKFWGYVRVNSPVPSAKFKVRHRHDEFQAFF